MNTSILDEKLALISFKMSLFSGYIHLTRALIKKLGGQFPDCEAAKTGTLEVFPHKALNPFHALRKRLIRYLNKIGIQAMDSPTTFVIPTSELADVKKELQKTVDEFNQSKAVLDTGYEVLFTAFVQNNAEAGETIVNHKVEKATALKRCHLATHIYRVPQEESRAGESKAQTIENQLRDFSRRLYEEVADVFTTLGESDAFARFRVTQNSLVIIRGQLAKMKRMEFLDASVPFAVKFGEIMMSRFPTKGYIEGDNFAFLQKFVAMMSDPDLILNAALLHQQGIDPLDILTPRAPVAKPQFTKVVKATPVVETPLVVEEEPLEAEVEAEVEAVAEAVEEPDLLTEVKVEAVVEAKVEAKAPTPVPQAALRVVPPVPSSLSKPKVPQNSGLRRHQSLSRPYIKAA